MLRHTNPGGTEILVWSGLEEASAEYASRALMLYQRYPLSGPTNLLDARILNFVCQVYASADKDEGAIPLTQSQMEGLWESILARPFSELHNFGLQRFLLIYLPIIKGVDAQDFMAHERRLKAWAGNEYASEISDIMGLRPGIVLLSQPS